MIGYGDNRVLVGVDHSHLYFQFQSGPNKLITVNFWVCILMKNYPGLFTLIEYLTKFQKLSVISRLRYKYSLTFGNKQAKTADWFEAHLYKIQLFIDEKRRALASYKTLPSERTLQMLRAPKQNPTDFKALCK